MITERLEAKNLIQTLKSGTTENLNYCNKTRVLEVEFKNGDVYHYKKVETEVWKEYKNEVLSGGSSGTFVNKKIKPFYEYDKVQLAGKNGRKHSV